MTVLDKVSARRHFRAARTAMAPLERETAAAAYAELVLAGLAAGHGSDACAHDGGSTTGTGGKPMIAAYLSLHGEPGTHRLLPALTGAGYDVVVPICEPGFRLSWCHWSPGAVLEPSPLAPVLEPSGPRFGLEIMAHVGTLLMPALALDRAGNRLGQGGGYYDRFLARLRALPARPRTVGVVYAQELVEAGFFEFSSLDIPLEGALTPNSWQWFKPKTV